MDKKGGAIYKSMSDNDIYNYLPDALILSYPQLKSYKSIDELLPRNTDYVIILYIEQESLHNQSGHWTTLYKYNNQYICYFGRF